MGARLLILGLDGATFDVLDPLFAVGALPALAALAQRGWRTELHSTLPVATLPAWTSFLTGTAPAVHGVTDLLLRVPGSYGLRPATAADRGAETFLWRLARRGLAVAALGVPGTYPPESYADGICVPGFDAPGAARVRADGIWPPALAGRLESLGGWRYATFNEHGPASERLRRAAPALIEDLERKERVILDLYRSRAWDLFFVHLQAADTAQHHLWHTHDRASPRAAHPELASAVADVWRRIDAVVARLLRETDPDARILAVSDHGMGGAADVAVHLNRFLAHEGLLRFAAAAAPRAAGAALRAGLARLPKEVVGAVVQRLPRALLAPLFSLSHHAAIDFGGTLAFSDELDYAPSVWLNLAGHFPSGTVDERQAEPILRRVEAGLSALRDPATGRQLIARVHRRADLPAGPYRFRAPDLTIEPAWESGYRASFLASRGPGPAVRVLDAREHDAAKGAGLPGVHKREGIFIAAGKGLSPLELPPLQIHQAGALVFPLLDQPIPQALKAALPGFTGELLPVETEATPAAAPEAALEHPAAADQRQTLEQLRALGYLD
ncbi:MAG: alkaline phosphatase family protein [Deltaproteobacteria bacterium]|nr:alkaline phosphatase family protein [Deltaproteobacteria bacterium]